MQAQQEPDSVYGRAVSTAVRDRLLEGMPVEERRLDVAGASTAVLEGGDGPPIVLLHGQGGFAGMWVRVIPRLVRDYRVVAPDLAGLGQSEVRTAPTAAERGDRGVRLARTACRQRALRRGVHEG